MILKVGVGALNREVFEHSFSGFWADPESRSALLLPDTGMPLDQPTGAGLTMGRGRMHTARDRRRCVCWRVTALEELSGRPHATGIKAALLLSWL